MSYLGNTPPILTSILLSFLSSQNYIKKIHVVEALGEMGNVSPEIVSALISLIGDHEFVRMYVASALGKTEASSAVVNSLLLLLGDPEISVYSQAASSLVNLAKKSDIIGSEVFQWLEQNPNHDRIGGAIDCLWSIVVE